MRVFFFLSLSIYFFLFFGCLVFGAEGVEDLRINFFFLSFFSGDFLLTFRPFFIWGYYDIFLVIVLFKNIIIFFLKDMKY